jgi:CheY-like chemotaxis protein
MYSILLVGQKREALSILEKTLTLERDIQVAWAESGDSAIKKASETAPDLVILDNDLHDMSGLELIRQLMTVNAFINTAVISSQPGQIFHEETEGLGVLAQLPPNPSDENIQDLLTQLRKMPSRVPSP